MAFILMSHKQIKICTEKPMEISNQVNRKREITTGNSTQMITFSAMENKEFWMVLQKLSVLRDMEMISQKPSLPKRQLKISKVFPQIFQDNQRIQDKVKHHDLITFTEFQMFKVATHGTLQDAFTVNQPLEKFYQTKILVNQ